MVWKTLLGKGIQVPQKYIKNSRSLLSIANILSEMNYTHSTTGREFALMQFELIVMLLKIYNYTRNLQTVPKGCFWFFPMAVGESYILCCLGDMSMLYHMHMYGDCIMWRSLWIRQSSNGHLTVTELIYSYYWDRQYLLHPSQTGYWY